MAAFIKRRTLTAGSPSGVVSSFLDSLLTTRGDVLRRGSTGPERLAALTADTFLGGDGTDVTTRTAAQVLTSLGWEVGTWTPTYALATPNDSSWSYSVQFGAYAKLGRMTQFMLGLTGTPTILTGTGNVRISIPTAADANGLASVGQMSSAWAWPASRTFVNGFVVSGQSYLELQGQGSAVGSTTFAVANLTDAAAHQIRINGWYRTAS